MTTAHDSMPPTDAGVAAETAPHHEPRTHETVTAESPRVAVAPAPDRSWSIPYHSCDLEVPMRHIELHTPEARPALRRLVKQVVDVEGPIHEDLLVQRLREAWGVGRAGSRIRDNINQVVRALTREGEIDSTGSFLDVANRTELYARHPGNDPERKVGHVAPVERQRALYELAAECPGMTQDELIRQACDFFGWKRPRQDTRGALEADVAALYRQGRLVGEEDSIVAAR